MVWYGTVRYGTVGRHQSGVNRFVVSTYILGTPRTPLVNALSLRSYHLHKSTHTPDRWKNLNCECGGTVGFADRSGRLMKTRPKTNGTYIRHDVLARQFAEH